MPKPMKWKIAALDRQESVGISELQRRIKAARQRVAVIVASAARDRKILISGRNREHIYAQVGSVYAQLDLGLKDWGKDLIQKTAIDWHDAAIKDIREQTGVDPSNAVTRFSREYAEDVFKRVHPEGKSLAAVLTEKMAEADTKALRGAVTDVFREGSLTGRTMNQMAQDIKGRWDSLAGDLAANRFVDNAGRAWDDGRYMQMLVRTTVARVSRDSYFDTLTKNGDDLAMIENVDGDACEICAAWDGVIISITGQNQGDYPTYNQALNAGWGHPNCRCSADRVDETIDKDAIKQQASIDNPDFEQAKGETDTQYRNRVTAEVADYSKNFGGDEEAKISIANNDERKKTMGTSDVVDNTDSISKNDAMEVAPIVSRDIPEDIKSVAIAETKKIIAEDTTGLDYGFRMLPEDLDKVSVGDPLNPSFEWDQNGNNTGTPLRGVSVTGIQNEDHVERAMKDFTSQGYYGRIMALVRGERNGSGQDVGEKLLAEAEIVKLWVVGKKK